ncbi:hypothetical protein SELMODRAFT_153911 [Selaginella moellendorffii]|uniref:Fatty acid desaturase domain-containing protein n=1 Tax=Selaginella moellendorffii TaxID=88036 RepID=D8SB62_SELML|nr:omega-6 fatty acid desaturase, chloroplastic [Selaginella moellendorffii]EFJ18198.1 hypothetical protein SELMODRAFT_153911 [Selaginella moellendorffii]|eukprot:XP_002980547.1 omega-6 fatty acid desaturase, chloroplastic [Selaginella moellendorffii]
MAAMHLQLQASAQISSSDRILASPFKSSGFCRLRSPRSQILDVSVNPKKRGVGVRAVAVPIREEVQTSIPGFTQLGEPVPEGLSLNDVVKTLPKEVFEVDDFKAFKTVAITVSSVAAGYAALAVAPWYLYPIVYAFLGTAVTGLFVIGHDCGHNSFSKSQLVNDVVGTIVMTPLIYPFEPWRIKHNTHHAHTNKLIMDTAWQPFRPHQYDNGSPLVRGVIRATMGPLWWMASVGHWIFWHFDLSKFRPQEQPKVKVSLAAVAAFAALVLAPLLVTQGPVGFVKWWLVPWLGFHFWMSTFTMVHHTAPHIPFKPNREWYAVEAQLNGTVHCDYPAWIDLLCHDISVHIPHHVSTKIPSYNLRKAYAAIQEKWDRHLNKAEFGFPLMNTILDQCNLFDARRSKWVKFAKNLRGDAVAATSD